MVVGHDDSVVTATVEEDTASVFNSGNHLPVYTVSQLFSGALSGLPHFRGGGVFARPQSKHSVRN